MPLGFVYETKEDVVDCFADEGAVGHELSCKAQMAILYTLVRVGGQGDGGGCPAP